MLIIHDGNSDFFGAHESHTLEDGSECGVHIQGGERRLLCLTPRTFASGEHPFAVPFSQSGIDLGFGAGVTIPESEWQARIQELTAKEARIDDQCNFPPSDQNGLSYCWTNSANNAATTKRVMQGHPFVQWSAASVGALITGYRNVGGNGGDSLQYLAEHGSVDAKLWGNNDLNRSLDNPQTQGNRQFHKVLKFIECQNQAERISCGLAGFPRINDYAWWGHSVMGVTPRWIDGTIADAIRNSWGDWGEKNKYGQPGFGAIQGGKMETDGCYAVIEVTAANQ